MRWVEISSNFISYNHARTFPKIVTKHCTKQLCSLDSTFRIIPSLRVFMSYCLSVISASQHNRCFITQPTINSGVYCARHSNTTLWRRVCITCLGMYSIAIFILLTTVIYFALLQPNPLFGSKVGISLMFSKNLVSNKVSTIEWTFYSSLPVLTQLVQMIVWFVIQS